MPNAIRRSGIAAGRCPGPFLTGVTVNLSVMKVTPGP